MFTYLNAETFSSRLFLIIHSTLQSLHMIKYWRTKHVLVQRPELAKVSCAANRPSRLVTISLADAEESLSGLPILAYVMSQYNLVAPLNKSNLSWGLDCAPGTQSFRKKREAGSRIKLDPVLLR